MEGKPIDFQNTEIAFASKSNQELKKAAMLFKLMNSSFLVNTAAPFGVFAVKFGLPFAKSIVKSTIFEQFCGGTSLLDSQPTIDGLSKHGVQTILDYGAEAKVSEEDFNKTMRENIRAIEFAFHNETVPVISTKITGLARFDLLEKLQSGVKLDKKDTAEFDLALKRIDSICHLAQEKKVGVYIDAEESWIQDTIDYIVNIMMRRYNRSFCTVYNTFQLYRHDRLDFLKKSFESADKEGYLLGAKLVRGAYMEKERLRAEEEGYASPIQENKEHTDQDYNAALEFCIKRYKQISSCAATHNLNSCAFQANLMKELDIPFDHPHLNFCQLYGMSDHLSFNLKAAGYNVAKYVPYGRVEEVVPYLVRRAKENSAVSGDMSREYKMISTELKRRRLA